MNYSRFCITSGPPLARFAKLVLLPLLASGVYLSGCGGGGADSRSTASDGSGTKQISNFKRVTVGTIAGQDVVVEGLELISRSHLKASNWRYEYSVKVSNLGESVGNITLRLVEAGTGTTIRVGEVSTGPLAAGATLAVASITVDVDVSQSLSAEDWKWTAAIEKTPQQFTRVRVDQDVPAAVAAAISQITSPINSTSLGKALRVPVLAEGASIVLATNRVGDILLAAITRDTDVALSVQSTAHAFVRLAMGAAPADFSAADMAKVDQAIKSRPEFDVLVQLLREALASGQVPAETPAVQQSLANLISAMVSGDERAASANADAARKRKLGLTGVQVGNTELPSRVVGNAFPSLQRVDLVSGNDLGGVLVKNYMPIHWTASTDFSTSGTTTKPIGVPVNLPRNQVNLYAIVTGKIASPEPASVPKDYIGAGSALNVKIYQSPDARYATYTDIGLELATLLFSQFLPGTEQCVNAVLPLIISPLSVTQLANQTAQKTFREYLQAGVGVDNWVNIQNAIYTCAAKTIVSAEFASSVLKFVTKISQVADAVQGAGVAYELFLVDKYVAVMPDFNRTVSVCEATFKIVNCTRTLRVVPLGQLPDPLATTGPNLSIEMGASQQLYSYAFDLYRDPTPATDTLIWRSSDSAVATVSSTGAIHAVAKGSASITAEDAWTGVTSLAVAVTVVDTGVGIDITDATCTRVPGDVVVGDPPRVLPYTYQLTLRGEARGGDLGSAFDATMALPSGATKVSPLTTDESCGAWTAYEKGYFFILCRRDYGQPSSFNFGHVSTQSSFFPAESITFTAQLFSATGRIADASRTVTCQ